MADKDAKKDTPADQGPRMRAVPSDPRLVVPRAETSPLVLGGKIAAWVGLGALLIALFWGGVTRTFGMGPRVTVIVGGALIVFWLVTNLASVTQQVRARGFQALLNSALFTLFVIGIVVTINFIAGRHHIFHADWSEDKIHSLSSGSVEILKHLEQDVTITVFMSPDYYGYETTKRLLDEYSIKSPKLKVQTFDPKLDFKKVEEYKRPFDGTIFVESGGKKEEVQGGTEERISSAIMAVTTGEKTRICFLTGHGELSLDAFGEKGLSVLKQYLENEQYQVESLSLATMEKPEVPGDCAVLAIVGAQQQLMAAEMEAIQRYVEQGGNLFLAIATPPAPDFAELLTPYGVTPLKGLAVDPAGGLQGNPTIPLIMQPQGHDIVKDLSMLALPTSIAFEVTQSEPPPAMPGAPPPPAQPATTLLETTGSAWLETDLSGAGMAKGPEEKGGPLALAVAIDLGAGDQQPEYPGAPPPPDSGERKARIVAVGDSDFALDALYQMGLRSNIFLATSSFAWLTKNDKLVTVPPQEPIDRTLVLGTPQKNLAILLSAVIVPLLILAAGLIVWWRRR